MENVPFNFDRNRNRILLDSVLQRNRDILIKPELFYPWWGPCTVKVLLYADGSLNFNRNNPFGFGLSAFAAALKDEQRSYVKFDITLAHRFNVQTTDDPGETTGPLSLGGLPNINNFKFSDELSPERFDVVFLFGISSGPYLDNADLDAINTFMNAKKGVFATGDHGFLGNGLCGQIPRVRSMRLWGNTNPDNNLNEVSMDGPLRNDTNRLGHDDISTFDDQSDDIPQKLNVKYYYSKISPLLREKYPHPLLCSKYGVIDERPDHPHEGECVEPTDFSQEDRFGLPEFPSPGIARPEVIATSSVPSNNTAGGSKEATSSHTFGSVCAYDGHKVNVGRVVTDATWHHFVDVNLIGIPGHPDSVKELGFLASTSGQEVLNKNFEFFINLAVWLAPPSRHNCFNSRLFYHVVNEHRIVESVLLDPRVSFKQLHHSFIYSLGKHAKDVIGKFESKCSSVYLTHFYLEPLIPRWIRFINPWWEDRIRPEISRLPWIDHEELFTFALGSAVLAIHEEIGVLDKPIDDAMSSKIDAVVFKGMERGLDRGIELLQQDMKALGAFQEQISREEYLIEGVVLDQNGKPLPNVRVRAVDQDFTGLNALGKDVMTDKEGQYRIPYKGTDFIKQGKESGGADIILYVLDEQGKTLLETSPHRNSSRYEEINLTVVRK